jgi:hypothetical protein
VEFLTGGDELIATSPRAARQNGCDPHTDGIVRMKETRDTLCILYCTLELYVPGFIFYRHTKQGSSIVRRPLKDRDTGFFITLQRLRVSKKPTSEI